MPSLWIVDRDPRRRAAIARVAGAPQDAVLGSPEEPRFDSAAPPDAVVLGVGGDLEAELQFAHRVGRRTGAARWILVSERSVLDSARELFDTLPADVLVYPPEPRLLRRLLSEPPGGAPLPLSQRPARDALTERFGRWFADLELPDLLRALDPRFTDVPLLVRGEPGTGRGLLARYVHTFGGTAGGALVEIVCRPESTAAELSDALAAGTRTPRARSLTAVWLEDVDRLSSAVQRQLASWIRFAPPEGAVRSARVRWLATCTDEPEPGLRQALAGVALHVPPLRDRLDLVARFANETALAWCARRGEPARRFGEDALAALEEYPWPGNVRELESVVTETLVASSANPIPVDDLQIDGVAFAPLDAGDIGVLLESDEPVVVLEDDAEDAPPLMTLEPLPGDEPGEPAAEIAPDLPAPADDASLRRLVGAMAHEVRNPLSTIRTFAELLPERYAEAEFRTHFRDLVGRDVRRIEDVVNRLRQLASLEAPQRDAVDVAALLEELLEERRLTIHERRLVVLKELDAERSIASGDPEQLHFAFEALVNKSLQLVPERGSVYLASRHHENGLRKRPSVRVLVRFHGPQLERAGAPVEGVSAAENSLEFALAEAVVRAHDGALAIDAAEGGETVIVLDLPAPASAPQQVNAR